MSNLVLAHLIVRSGGPTETYPLKAGTNCIGRLAENDVCLPDPAGIISRRHCSIDIEYGTVKIRDLGSANGTKIEGRANSLSKLIPVELHDGQEIELGSGLKPGSKESLKMVIKFSEELKLNPIQASAARFGAEDTPGKPEDTPDSTGASTAASENTPTSPQQHRRKLESRKTVVLSADQVAAAIVESDKEEVKKEEKEHVETVDEEKLKLIAEIQSLQRELKVEPSSNEILMRKVKPTLLDQLKTLQIMQESIRSRELSKLAAAERRRSRDLDPSTTVTELTEALGKIDELEEKVKTSELQKLNFKRTAEEYSEVIEHWEKRYNDLARIKEDKIEALEAEIRTSRDLIDNTTAQLRSSEAKLSRALEEAQTLEQANEQLLKEKAALEKKFRNLKSLAAELTALAEN